MLYVPGRVVLGLWEWKAVLSCLRRDSPERSWSYLILAISLCLHHFSHVSSADGTWSLVALTWVIHSADPSTGFCHPSPGLPSQMVILNQNYLLGKDRSSHMLFAQTCHTTISLEAFIIFSFLVLDCISHILLHNILSQHLVVWNKKHVLSQFPLVRNSGAAYRWWVVVTWNLSWSCSQDVETKQDPVGLPGTNPFCVLHFLFVRNRLHSTSLAFPEFQRADSAFNQRWEGMNTEIRWRYNSATLDMEAT